MRKRWKGLEVILGVFMLVVCQNGIVQAKTEEPPTAEKFVLQDETDDQGDTLQKEEEDADKTVTVEKKNSGDEEAGRTKDGAADIMTKQTENPESNAPENAVDEDTEAKDSERTNEEQLQEATDLKWSANGVGIFTNPNERAFFIVEILKDGTLVHTWKEYYAPYGKEEVKLDLYHIIAGNGVGTYKFRVKSVADGYKESGWTEYSPDFTYNKEAETQLPVPSFDISEEGVVSCSLLDDSYELGQDYGFNYLLFCGDSAGNLEDGYMAQQGLNQESFPAAQAWEELLTPGRAYFVRVETLSRDITKYKDSEMAEAKLLVDRTGDSSSESKEDDSESSSEKANLETREESVSEPESESKSEPEIEAWKPATPDEMKRYAVFGKEKPNIAADTDNAYSVTIYNAMQGKQCFSSFEAVLGDWVIGRTYNILPSGRNVYKMDSKARIALTIPKTLQAAGREFKMICVTEKGQPVLLEDLDTNAETITFETDTYYAFAMIYKDAASQKY